MAVHKCGVADAGQAVWQINASQADAVLKCHESDRLELGGIRNADKTGTAGERAHGNGSYVVRQGNAGQVGALSEAPLTDSGHTIGNGYRGDVGAEGKSKVADACYTAVDDDLLYVESVLEPRRIPFFWLDGGQTAFLPFCPMWTGLAPERTKALKIV